MLLENKQIFFASANTTKGFRNYFQQVFHPNRFEEIFIIKGGPGTGKSSFMRTVASWAEKKGYTVALFACSSDPLSLDAIIIHEKSIVILDGTSPHTTEPKYPGVVENIINTGLFWNTKKLLTHKKEIIHLIQEKSQSYKQAYRFLNAAGEIDEEIANIGEKALLSEKAERNIQRLTKRIFPQDKSFEEEIRLISSMNAEGHFCLETFQNASTEIYIIEDALFTAHTYLAEIYKSAKETKQTVYKSFSCRFPDKINALYFPKLGISFVIGEKNYDMEDQKKTYHYINMHRFVDQEIIKQNRQKIRFGKKCADMLYNGAKDSFLLAKKHHEALEKIYISAMDFQDFSKMCDDFLTKIE